ncbi:alcohol dehydrogenase superfamily protein [Mycena belliarum]|uniref:Alcohol dehydrogenase superfamily protein n=1 Tax=Mycena belliarum TaxID=1033014 RepID=A0AAD6XLD5_9AGAR|nr:alcohol dehydrogenase superfamily protein [Mycena belliae]
MGVPTTTHQYSYPELGSYDNLVLNEVPRAAPKPHEVLVRTRAVSLQFRDLLIANRQYPSPVVPNLVPCSDMAGEVIAVGEDVKTWKAGDRVCANFFLDKLNDEQTPETDASALGGAVHGVLTEYRTFPAHALVAIPSHLSYEEASTLPCAALTAYNALLCGYAPLKAGDTVVVQGTGGVSLFALQFAVASGATVIATSSSDDKLKAAKEHGAAHIINYRTTPDWDREVLEITGGVGADRVIEVAGNATLQRSINSVKLGGSIDIIGLLGGAGDVPPVDIIVPTIFRSLKIRGLYVGSVPQFHNMNKLIAANASTTRPIVDRVFPFAEAKAAFAYLASQAHVGKVVIKL